MNQLRASVLFTAVQILQGHSIRNPNIRILYPDRGIKQRSLKSTHSYNPTFADSVFPLLLATLGKRYPYTSGIARCDFAPVDAPIHASRHKQDTLEVSLQAGG